MDPMRKAARLVLYGLAALGLLMLLTTFTPLVPWYARALAGNWTDGTGEVLIVLGGGTIDGVTLAPGSYWRSVYAARAYRQTPFRAVVVSGSGVAPLMKDFLIGHGIPESVIQVESGSTSTRENALEARKLLAKAPGRKVLLTSDYHMFRAYRTFRKAGLDVTPRPFPDVLKSANHVQDRWPAFLTECLETLKIGYYWARGWI